MSRAPTRRARAAAPAPLLTLMLTLSLIATPAAVAQTTGAPDDAPRRSEPLVTRRDFAVAGAFLAASALLSVWDRDVYRAFQDSSVQDNRFLRERVKEFNYLQETYLTVGGLAAYGVGRLSGNRTVADIGLHVAEAVFVASAASQLIRGPLGRARPTANGGTDQYDFAPGKGFREFEHRAFPSIHSSSGFAAATVVVREVADRWPRHTRWVGPTAYALAFTPGFARMYLGQHWASDVLMGAAIGVIAGQRVVTYNHRNPDNRVNRFFLGRAATSEPAPATRIGLQFRF